MIKRIEMDLPHYKVVIENKTLLINDRSRTIDDEVVNNILRIIRNWKREYKNGFVENLYTIRVVDDEETIFKFYDTFPDDFFVLKDYLGDLYVGR